MNWNVYAKGVRTTGRSSQRKGRLAELELARILQSHGYDVEPGRAQSYGEVPDLIGLPGVHIEVKRVERLNVPEAMAQAIRDSEKFSDGTPVLFHRRSRSHWMVTMLMDDWLTLYKARDAVVVHNSNECKKGGINRAILQD